MGDLVILGMVLVIAFGYLATLWQRSKKAEEKVALLQRRKSR